MIHKYLPAPEQFTSAVNEAAVGAETFAAHAGLALTYAHGSETCRGRHSPPKFAAEA